MATSWSCTILTTIWPGVTDFMTSTPTACFLTLSEGARDIERDIGFQQRAANFAHRGIDVGFAERAAAGEAVENAAEFFRQLSNMLIPYERPLRGLCKTT